MKKGIKENSGFTMLEVIIGLAIFAIGLLGVMGISTLVLYYNAMSRQITTASMLAVQLADELQHLQGANFNSAVYSDTNSGNNTQLGVIDIVNSPPTSPAPEHSEVTDLGRNFPVVGGITYERYWNVRDMDQNNDGVIDVKVITVIVRWRNSRESSFHYTDISTGLFRSPGA